MKGGAYAHQPARPRTNSSGTTLSWPAGGRPMKGPLLGVKPAIDREDTKVNMMINSIYRGCWSLRTDRHSPLTAVNGFAHLTKARGRIQLPSKSSGSEAKRLNHVIGG